VGHPTLPPTPRRPRCTPIWLITCKTPPRPRASASQPAPVDRGRARRALEQKSDHGRHGGALIAAPAPSQIPPPLCSIHRGHTTGMGRHIRWHASLTADATTSARAAGGICRDTRSCRRSWSNWTAHARPPRSVNGQAGLDGTTWDQVGRKRPGRRQLRTGAAAKRQIIRGRGFEGEIGRRLDGRALLERDASGLRVGTYARLSRLERIAHRARIARESG
jgi:hypothetical protein